MQVTCGSSSAVALGSSRRAATSGPQLKPLCSSRSVTTRAAPGSSAAARRRGRVSSVSVVAFREDNEASKQQKWQPRRRPKHHPQHQHQHVPKHLLDRVDAEKWPDTRSGPVVVALDNTDNAQQALEWAANFLLGEGDELVVVHVLCDPLACTTSVGTSPLGRPIVYDALSSLPSTGRDHNRLGEHRLHLMRHADEMLQRRTAGVRNMGLCFEGEVVVSTEDKSAAAIGEAIVRAAQARDARLLVVASNYSGCGELLVEFGSVARYCFQHADVPLVLVPPCMMDKVNAKAGSSSGGAVAAVAAVAASGDEARALGGLAAAAGAIAGMAAAAMPVPAPVPAPETLSAPGERQGSHVVLVVNNLEELQHCWQWVVDNICDKDDTVELWHVAGPSASGLPSLPVALATAMQHHGLREVRYHPVYCDVDAQEQSQEVSEMVSDKARNANVKAVVVVNYTRQGMLREALYGSIASQLTMRCPVPLVLLQPPEA